jgi:NodT family efflux transporter outer membrane factor (OMF) lipoprotein
MKILRIGCLVALLSVLHGCALGPRYRAPKLDIPVKWSEISNGTVPSGAVDLSDWWTAFHDPVLYSLVTRAIHSNLDLRIAEARIREARAARGIVAADRLPSIDASASATRSERSESLPPFRTRAAGGGGAGNAFGDRIQDLFQAGFDASWEIDVFGGIRRGVEAASADVEAVVEDRRDVLVTLLAEVSRNYVELRGNQIRKEILKKNLMVQRDTLILTKVRFAAGLASDLDVARAAALVSTTQAHAPVLETAARQAIHRIGVLLGEHPGSLIQELTKEGPIPLHPPDVPMGLPSDLLRRRPDIRRAERELAAATARIGVAMADLFPRFSLTGSFGRRSDAFGDLTAGAARFWGFGPDIRWPIFAGGRIRANVQAQDARREQALAVYERTVLTSMEEVENSLVAYSQERERRLSLNSAFEANRNAVDLASSRYSGGLEDFLTVLDAQRLLYASQDTLAQSEQAVAVNVIGLYKALGGGWENTVAGFEGAARISNRVLPGAGRHALARFRSSMAEGSSSSSNDFMSSFNWSRLVALAMGAVMPGRAINQARATVAGDE